MSQKLLAPYVNPSEPGSLGGVAKFAKARGLSNPKAKKLLEEVLIYTLHEPRRGQFPTRPVMAFFYRSAVGDGPYGRSEIRQMEPRTQVYFNCGGYVV